MVITVRDVGSKLDYKWKGLYRVKKLFANVYELEDLRTKKRIGRDVLLFVQWGRILWRLRVKTKVSM